MMGDAEAVRVLRRVALQHDRGIICPALMWGEVLRVVDRANPARTLGLAPSECRTALRAIYHDRPCSLHHERCEDEVLRAVVEWCLALGDDPSVVTDATGG
jgi:hypothetical protein